MSAVDHVFAARQGSVGAGARHRMGAAATGQGQGAFEEGLVVLPVGALPVVVGQSRQQTADKGVTTGGGIDRRW